MKAHGRIRRALRSLALTGCLAALVIPAAASAMPDYHPRSPSATPVYHPHGRPAAYAGSAATTPNGQESNAHYYQGSTLVPGRQTYKLPAGFGTDIQSGGQPATAASHTTNVVVRKVQSSTDAGDHTLAIVLASAALGIALCGTAYATIRVTRIQRRVAQSGS